MKDIMEQLEDEEMLFYNPYADSTWCFTNAYYNLSRTDF